MSPYIKTPRLTSLKSLYIGLSSLVSILLVSAALIATWYAQHVTMKNTQSLKLRDEVTSTTNKIRNQIWSADIALNTILIRPSDEFTSQLTRNLDSAVLHLNSLMKKPETENTGLLPQMHELKSHLSEFSSKINELLKLREDPNWVYPVMPYINNKLLEPNLEFETAAEQALREIADNDGQSYASQLYGRFDEVRDLWRRKILNFRAVVIRFSGLNEQDNISQVMNIENLHEVIENKMAELQELSDAGELGLQAEVSLEKMRAASQEWDTNWKIVKQYRASSVWRSDLQYMQSIVRPAQEQLLNTLTQLEAGIQFWSEKNIDTVQQAARQISTALWALSALAIIFVILIYILLNRTVLRPITFIANTMSNEGVAGSSQLHNHTSKEIHQLIKSFEIMRRQIHQRQIALEHQALHDSLTGLPNRSLLHDRLEQTINIMNRNKQTMALLLLDLDRFKDINDALGHQVGDELLQQVGQRLVNKLRETDTVARLGGDEFAIVAPSTSLSDAKIFAEKVVSEISQVYIVGNQNLYVGASIGLALYPDHGKDPGELIRHADIAMYHAKRNNLGYSIYEQDRDEEHLDKLALVGDLHKELSNTQNLQIFYQPLINLPSRRVAAVEILLRWQHPQMGSVAPEHIISMAEHTGLIGPLTHWIIETAIQEYTEAQLGKQNIKLAINLSAWNLQDPELPGAITDLLHRYALPPERLIFEITESAMMNDPVHARRILHQLSDMGIELSIDDFGTGFSSLGYLKLLPVNSLKIDKSFVIDMLSNDNDALIVQSTIDLAHNLGLSVIAEGVENEEILLRLRSLKCDVAQGYHIARPQPRDTFMQWLNRCQPKIAQ